MLAMQFIGMLGMANNLPSCLLKTRAYSMSSDVMSNKRTQPSSHPAWSKIEVSV